MAFNKIKRFILKHLPSKIIVSREFKDVFGYKLDLKHPKTLNEKIQWLKVYDKKDSYTLLVDKIAVRKYVANTIGESYLIPLLGEYDNFDDIDFEKLPSEFVIKTNNSSGGVVVCRNKDENFDIEEARKIIDYNLTHNFYEFTREYPYKNIKPSVMVEKYIGKDKLPADYKILCFNGKADNIMICYDRESKKTKFFFFDLDWNLLRYNYQGLYAEKRFSIPKPDNLTLMIELAEKLSENLPLARIDFYNIDGKIYFGEITLYPDSGYDKNILPEFDLLLGNKLKLPLEEKKWIL